MIINKFTTLLGYEKTLTPMRATKVADILRGKFRYSFDDGEIIVSEAEMIVYAIQQGIQPEEHTTPKCHVCKRKGGCIEGNIITRQVCAAKDKVDYYVRYTVTKTGYNFALWLIAEGLTTYEAVQTKINSEITEKERSEQETAKINQERELLAETEQQAESAYQEWLGDALRNYGGIDTLEGERILIQRDIFVDVFGEYNDRAKEFLVLIDNIDIPRCRKDIISRLRNGNIASIKTFEYITGIKLEKTYKKRKEQLEQITKADYAKSPKQYKPRIKAKSTEYNTLFYIYETDGDNGRRFSKALGALWQYKGVDFYIRVKESLWIVTEGRTGLVISRGKSLTESKTNNKKQFKDIGDKFDELVQKNIKRNGISPLYAEK